MKLRFLIAVLTLAILAGFAPRAFAQAPEIQMQVIAAFDGYFKYGEWLPLVAQVENRGGDTKAELRVRVGSTSGGGTTFTVPVELAAGARKVVPIYVLPNNFTRVLEVRLVNGDSLLASQQVSVRPQPNLSYFVGFVAPQRGALSLISGVSLPGSRPLVLVDVTPDELPERPEGLAMFNTLVFNDVDTSKLTTQQASALMTWVESGGRLVLGGGAGAQQIFAGLPESIRPVNLTGTNNIQTDDLADLAKFAGAESILATGPFVVSIGQVTGGRVMAGTPELPLLVERSANKGSIDFVALDLSTSPFEGWSGTRLFWETLLTPGAALTEGLPPDASPRQMRTSSFYGPLTNIPSLDLPSVRGLSFLLVIYILLVGPVNYFVLRRSKRLHLAWITIPMITVVFAAASFGIGYALRGNDLILNKIAIIEAQKEGPARVTSYIGLFSPRQQAYEIQVQGESLLSPATPDYGPGGPNTGQEMVFVQGQPSLVQGLSVSQFSMQSFMSENLWPDFGNLTGKLTLDNETLKGTVKNDTPYPLKEAVIVVNRRFQKLGDLAPGQEVEVNLGLTDLSKDSSGPPLSYRLYMEPLNTPGQPYSGRMPRDVMQKTNILDNIFDGPIWMKINSSVGSGGYSPAPQGVILFGWMNQAPPEISVRGQQISQVTTSLVYTTLNIGMPKTGRLALPPGLLPGRLVQSSPGMGTCGPYATASIFLDNAEATFEFQIPAELSKFKIDALKLSVFHDNTTAAYKGSALYDWKQEKWMSLDPKQGSNLLITNPEPYLNENGQVRVKVSAGAGSPSCYYIDMGLQAEAQAGQGG